MTDRYERIRAALAMGAVGGGGCQTTSKLNKQSEGSKS